MRGLSCICGGKMPRRFLGDSAGPSCIPHCLIATASSRPGERGSSTLISTVQFYDMRLPTHRGLLEVCKLDHGRRKFELDYCQPSGNYELAERITV